MSQAVVLNDETANVVLFGGSGYVGSLFQEVLRERGVTYFAPSSSMLNMLHHGSVEAVLDAMKPTFVINCAGYTGKPNVDACESFKEETRSGNVLAPFNLAQTCDKLGIAWGHVSSGCIYDGYDKVFTEEDEPNFCFDNPPCSHYSGTKAEAEKMLKDMGCYVWRLRIPFDEFDSPRNYISKVMNYDTLLDVPNSISHRRDFVEACLDLWGSNADHGIYNVINGGSVKASEVLDLFTATHGDTFEHKTFMDDIQGFYKKVGCATPRSNCVLSNEKLLNAGVKMRTAKEALQDAIENWTLNED